MVQSLKISRKLIIIAHPDDEAFGCSALLQNSAIILVTDSDEPNFSARKKILQGICKDLVIPLYNCGLPPCELDKIGIQKVHNWIDSAAKNIDADYIITHNPNDMHQDHRIISNAVDILARSERSKYKGLIHFSFENHSHNLVAQSNCEIMKKYSNLVDINFYKTVQSYKAHIGTKYNCKFGDTFEIKFLR